jgi:hypothetical protein
MTDPLSIASDHVSWLRSQDVGIVHALRMIDMPCDPRTTWDDVTDLYALAYEHVRCPLGPMTVEREDDTEQPRLKLVVA